MIFDEVIDRRNIYSEKWDLQGGEFIPMWVADMDFRIPEPITKALYNRVDKGTFGFSFIDDGMADVIVSYYREQYGCTVLPEWIVWVNSVMPAANLACRIAGGDIMINIPMYPHIRHLPEEARTGMVEVPLMVKNGKYAMDFEAMEKAYTENVKVFVMSNPHNPTGRTFTREELEELNRFCIRHNILMVSDEIHCGLVLEGKHIPYFDLNEEAMNSSITLSSPSKTYNIPAIPYAFAIIPNVKLRERFKAECFGLFSPTGVLGIEAMRAAYSKCEEWRKALIQYLITNRDYMESRIAEMKGLSVVHNEATYLAWIDARGLGVDDPYTFFREKAGVNLHNGVNFAAPGFVRMNFGCPRSQLKEALDRMETAINNLNL